jgi:phosphatidylserine decarboxylase
MRLSQTSGETWLFPSATKSGHIEASTLRKQHGKALAASGVAPFELYVLRHTCLTRWAKWMDPFTFHRVAGHVDMKTTMRYVHPSDADMDEAIAKARKEEGGYTFGHTQENGSTVIPEDSRQAVEMERFVGATRRDRTGLPVRVPPENDRCGDCC